MDEIELFISKKSFNNDDGKYYDYCYTKLSNINNNYDFWNNLFYKLYKIYIRKKCINHLVNRLNIMKINNTKKIIINKNIYITITMKNINFFKSNPHQ